MSQVPSFNFIHHQNRNIMRAAILFIFIALFGLEVSAQVLTVGAGTGAGLYHGPIYRFSASSTSNYTKNMILYTEAELTTAGLSVGSSITELAWYKTDAFQLTNGSSGVLTLRLRMGSTATSYPTGAHIFTESASGFSTVATINFNAAGNNINGPAGWVPITLGTPVVYTGGSLEVYADWVLTSGSGNPSSGPFNWQNHSTGTDFRTLQMFGSAALTSTGTTYRYNLRGDLRLTYVSAASCTNPPNAGTVILTPAGPVCAGTNVTLDLSGNSTGSGITYQWESSASNAPFTPTALAPPASSSSFIVNPATTTWYRAKVVCNNNTPVYSSPVQLQVTPAPVVNLGSDTVVCGSGGVVLNAGNTGATYLWDNNSTAQTRTVSSAGTYYVRVTQGGCHGYDTITVSYGAVPTVNLGADTTLCPGSSLTLSAGNAGSSYLWDNAATSQTRVVTTAGTYYVRVTNASNCVGRDTIVLTAATAPQVSLGNDTTICDGSSLTLDAGNTGNTYLWDNNSTNQTRTLTVGGTYYVVVTNSSYCKSSDTFVLGLHPNPTVDLGGTIGICDGSQTTLDAGNTGSTYLWDDASTAQTRTVSIEGTYYVTVTDANGCRGSDTVTVSIQPLPWASITAAAGNNGNYTFTATQVIGTVTGYTWNFGDGSANGTGVSVQHTYTDNGAYTVTLTLAGPCGPISVTKNIEVTGIVGIQDYGIADKNWLLYPNPANNEIHLSNKGKEVIKGLQISNILGQQVYSLQNLRTSGITISLAGLPLGVYLLKVHTEGGSLLRKFEILR
jgi:hypothetical protein